MNDFEAQLLREIKKFRYTVIGIVLVVIVLSIAFVCYLQEHSSVFYRYEVTKKSELSQCDDESFDFNQKAKELFETGKHKEGILLSEERIETCPFDAHAWFYKARALAMEKQWDDALESLGKAGVLNPDLYYMHIKPLSELIIWSKGRDLSP
ncbi:MAG: hypothetical protein LBE15_02085 [Burkholderiales bacterium]|jgi:tetratricopeptide (TPR) repeat protein|nr:hypothetical protein [Burkholderiales bacterium]